MSSLKFRDQDFQLESTDSVQLTNVLHQLREQNLITRTQLERSFGWDL
jgi:hypothetical protein